MSRDWQIYGPAMVSVKFGPDAVLGLSDLGLTLDPIHIALDFHHQPVKTDAYGPDIPVDMLSMMAQATITTKLVHWDPIVASICLSESCGGGVEGSLPPAGQTMGGLSIPAIPGAPFIPGPGYHYISLNIRPSPAALSSLPWRFPATLLTERPVELSLGTERSLLQLTWKAIPYGAVPKVITTSVSGVTVSTAASVFDLFTTAPTAFLWDHTLDV